MRNRSISQRVYEELCEVIPGGVNSPVRACRQMGQLPLVIDYVFGDRVIDVMATSFIDYAQRLGALFTGRALNHPEGHASANA